MEAIPDLSAQDRYEHPGNARPGPLARLWPSAAFYPRAFRVVASASRRSKQGTFDAMQWRASAWEIVRVLEGLGTGFEVEGLDHLRATEEPCVFIGNHMSTLETFILPAFTIPAHYVAFVIKPELLEVPIFKHVMRWTDPIVVSRKDPRADLKAVLEGGRERLKARRSVVVFPQTTRTPAVTPETFTTLGDKLARRSDATVIPIALKTNVWGLGRFLKDWGPIDPSKKVRIHFGEPRRLTGAKAEHTEMVRWICERVDRWRAEDGET
jgi:1-acyl-sn-glycerol-3-phosphate acyltransferase